MNITCPKCETVFFLSSNTIIGKKLKCSVCEHKWTPNNFENKKDIIENENDFSSYNKILILNIFIIFLVIIAFFLFRDYLESVDLYLRIYKYFEELVPI